MKLAQIILVASLAVVSLAAPEISLRSQFRQFQIKHNKKYSSKTEHELRFRIFNNNVEKIKQHNNEAKEGKHTYTMRVNQFADLTADEFKSQMLTYKPKPRNESNVERLPSNINRPDSINWVDEGYVTAIKDQGQCGSCWAFSAAGSIEGALKKKTGQIYSVSPQLFVDCDTTSQGCNGGWMDNAFTYAQINGFMPDNQYPYAGYEKQCSFDASKATKLAGFKDVSPNESSLQDALGNVGPVSVAVYADNFQFYGGGVYTSYCAGQVDHAVLAVGYGVENSQQYYLIKNSWGTWWGDKGYLKLGRNMNNLCGVASYPSYAIA